MRPPDASKLMSAHPPMVRATPATTAPTRLTKNRVPLEISPANGQRNQRAQEPDGHRIPEPVTGRGDRDKHIGNKQNKDEREVAAAISLGEKASPATRL